MATTYREYKKARQEAINGLPLHWAFGDKQFDELCGKLGVTADDFVQSRALGGALILKSDWPEVKEFFDRPNELDELMGDYEFAKDAFKCEMYNHEYAISWQGDWDVIRCFANVDGEDAEDMLPKTGWSVETKRAYVDAANEVMEAFGNSPY